jgi:hypothetical protein
MITSPVAVTPAQAGSTNRWPPLRSSSLPRSVARAVRPERQCLLGASLGLSLSVEPAELERVTGAPYAQAA